MSGIVGYSYGTIENCTNNADVTALNNHVGGITGRCQSADGIFINCHNTGSVSGGAYVGGIAGSCLGDVTNCTNTGDVTGSAQYGVGGIIGITSDASSVSVTGCYNTGDITSTTTGFAWVGGIVGSFPNQNARGSIESCYNTGVVSATAEGSVCSGGILGGGYGDITNCYNTGTVTGSVNVGAVGGFVNGTVEKAYYLTGSAAAGIGLASVAAIATERTAEQMTGPNALDETNMNLDSDIWTAGGEDTWEYLGENEDGLGDYGFMAKLPQLTVFEGNGHEGIMLDTATGMVQETDPDDGKTYYLIDTAEQLAAFRNIVNNTLNAAGERIYTADSGANGRLTNNIDLNPGITFNADGSYTEETTPQQWTPMGSYAQPYTGSFDGNGKVISGLYINNSTASDQGLFGDIGEESSIQNLGLVNSYISAGEYTGSLAGCVWGGDIQNCFNTGAVISSSDNVGGLVGDLEGGTIQNCYNTGSVSGNGRVGGIAGMNFARIVNCFNTGTISGTADTGGVAGSNSGTVSYCYYLDTCGAAGRGNSRTVQQMTGDAVRSYMSGFNFTNTWGIKAETSSTETGDTDITVTLTTYYPYLRVFGEDSAPVATASATHQMQTEEIDGETYYLIYTAEQLKIFRNIVNNTLTEAETAAVCWLSFPPTSRRRKKIPGTPPFPPWAPGNTASPPSSPFSPGRMSSKTRPPIRSPSPKRPRRKAMRSASP